MNVISCYREIKKKKKRNKKGRQEGKSSTAKFNVHYPSF